MKDFSSNDTLALRVMKNYLNNTTCGDAFSSNTTPGPGLMKNFSSLSAFRAPLMKDSSYAILP